MCEQSESAEEILPIVLSTADERQLLHPSITHVDRDVPQILCNPPQRNRRRMTIAAFGEVQHERHRHDELEQRAAGNADHLAEDAEHKVSGLVNGEVDSVEQAA